MAFTDKVEIEIKAGKGGDGKLSFRHEKYRAKGGPDGGDGGKGGDVVFQVDHNLDTLSHYRTSRLVKAEDGQAGGDNRKKGKAGAQAVVRVPPGTVVCEGDEILADLTTNGQIQILADGGRGGFGNAHFTSSTRQAPRAAELGEPGEKRKVTLELKMVADVGLVGLPNAGKSTLLSVISNAKPEIGDYPFTTIVPNLGIVDFESVTFMVADIPGLIEGASKGKGLGDEFLRHIERTEVLLHLIDANSEDLAADYRTIQQELRDYQVNLTDKPQIVVLTKTEGLDQAEVKRKQAALKSAGKVIAISAQAHQGLDDLLREVSKLVKTARQTRRKAEEESLPVISLETLPDLWKIEPVEGGFQIKGQRIEGFARRTDMDNPHAVERLRDIMSKMGIKKELDRMHIKEGDRILIADKELEYLE